jgi:hypothetical protein
MKLHHDISTGLVSGDVKTSIVGGSLYENLPYDEKKDAIQANTSFNLTGSSKTDITFKDIKTNFDSVSGAKLSYSVNGNSVKGTGSVDKLASKDEMTSAYVTGLKFNFNANSDPNERSNGNMTIKQLNIYGLGIGMNVILKDFNFTSESLKQKTTTDLKLSSSSSELSIVQQGSSLYSAKNLVADMELTLPNKALDNIAASQTSPINPFLGETTQFKVSKVSADVAMGRQSMKLLAYGDTVMKLPNYEPSSDQELLNYIVGSVTLDLNKGMLSNMGLDPRMLPQSKMSPDNALLTYGFDHGKFTLNGNPLN